jgi:quercetin dioxygenase-like cupin family protein
MVNRPSAQFDSNATAEAPPLPAGADLIAEAAGIDDAEKWASSWEGKDHNAGISVIHLSTTQIGVGPPLHRHPYPEIIMIRQGQAEFTLGSHTLTGRAGHTVVIPPDTAHTFRTLGPGRYESIAIHQSPLFVTELLEPDNHFP